ncbi:MAG: hypothetical protein GXZ08_02090 [Tissierellia bacterium]|nr:hypothetical protein [Tissierellia bacterium]
MTREELSQYRDLLKEIKGINNRINKLQERKIEQDIVKASNIEYPYQEMNVHIEGLRSNQVKINKLMKILENRQKKCDELRIDIEEFISDIPDSRTRRIFEMRYFEGLSWMEISKKLNSYDESFSRKIHNRYLS